jgi:membrane-anchored protein YejM (alkaline phosphatase superfamily)
VRLSLVFTTAGWRIDDIAEDDMPSLRKFLRTKQ